MSSEETLITDYLVSSNKRNRSLYSLAYLTASGDDDDYDGDSGLAAVTRTLMTHNAASSHPLPSSSPSACKTEAIYLDIEAYCYLFIMCPLALVGILLNIVSLWVFRDKSFNTVTFKYLRLIALTDIFICLIIIPYCLTAYTQPFNKYDMLLRQLYLAYVYIPGANLVMNLNMLLNLLVTIERLISVGWPIHKYTLFKPSRYYLSCVVVLAVAFLSNVVNFFMYKVELCRNVLIPRHFLMTSWWTVYGYAKETVTRILPIVLLVVANVVLVFIVRRSRQKMRDSVSISKSKASVAGQGGTCKRSAPGTAAEATAKPLLHHSTACAAKTLAATETATATAAAGAITQAASAVAAAAASTTSVRRAETIDLLDKSMKGRASHTNKRNRQENQLTWMTIFVAILYLASSIPMVFAYPGILFSAMEIETKQYKMYAVLVNCLELIQCSFRFLVYYCFTTQFRTVFNRMHGLAHKKEEQQHQQQHQQHQHNVLAAPLQPPNAGNSPNIANS